MKRFTLSIIITGLFYVQMPAYINANEAGGSAMLNLNSRIKKSEISAIILEKKKQAIKSVLERYESPMILEDINFINACVKYNLDCYLLPAIAGLESTFGRFIWPNSNNPFGWDRGYMMFESWKQSIDTVGQGLRINYLNRGALTIYEIGSIYSESPTWASRIAWFITQFKNEEEKLSLQYDKIPVKL